MSLAPLIMETNLDNIKKLSKEREDENWGFRSYLKGYDVPDKKIDSLVHDLNKKISSAIDCRKCMNCCKKLRSILDNGDIEKLSQSLNISADGFKAKYLVKDEEEQGFKFNVIPCPFLKNDGCSCYEHRPKACASFPHLHKKRFVTRLIGVIENCSVCPIVFNVYERLKEEIWVR